MRTEEDRLTRAVRTEVRRRRRSRGEGERTFAQQLALGGSVGWLIVIPALLGIALGRWLDRRLATGISLTAGFLVLGVALGVRLVWRRIRET